MILLLFLLGQLPQLPGLNVELRHAQLTESSGVCVSYDGRIIWTHNDSGDSPRVFGFLSSGDPAVIANIPGVPAIDWEDMCSFKRDGRNFLAIADVGDNQKRRRSVSIYVLEDPARNAFDRSQGSMDKRKNLPALAIDVSVVCQIKFTYPGGPTDCEGLAYDPRRQTFVLASKELLRTRLFEVDASSLEKDQTLEATMLGTYLVPMVTGADISRDGSKLVLVTYGPGCLIRRTSTVNSSRTKWSSDIQYFELPHRKQGESICFDQAGHRLFLTSEFTPTPLHNVPLPVPDSR